MSIISQTADSIYWDGDYSRCRVAGTIESCIRETIQNHSLPISMIIPKSDGFIGDTEYTRLCNEFGRFNNAITSELRYSTLESLRKSYSYPIIGALCSRQVDRTNLVLLPLDDETCRIGLDGVLSGIPKTSWVDKKPIVFWRGGSSGLDRPSLRTRVASELLGHPNTDVRITPWGNWENDQSIPTELFAPRCSLEEHFKYKYVLIVDGNCIASNHQWVFGSGSVPIMITHPDNKFWFQKYLKPMVNYVPIKYDLSDLKEKVDWLVSHDEEAKQIADTALAFSKTVFSPEFQKRYIKSAILGILYNTQSDLVVNYSTMASTPSDINEHLETLYNYAKQCTRIVECGVREIVSSYAFASAMIGKPNHSFTMIDLYESTKMKPFLEMCKAEGINASFIEGSDTHCKPIQTDLLFIDTWHIYGHLKRELAHWHASVQKYILLHDTTVDALYGESIRANANTYAQSIESGYPEEEIRKGLWPAITEFLDVHPEWRHEKRYTHNNGLTILARNTDTTST
jgi:hypothetical protein